MDRTQMVQGALDFIDSRLNEELSAEIIAGTMGYSVYHFSRVFAETVGISVMAYVKQRRLQFALYDLSRGKKVIDTAMEYGFQTHAGFTKAFAGLFGFPPSLCRLRLAASPPPKADAIQLKNRFSGGNAMTPHIIELTPFAVVGWPSRHTKENMRHTADAPTYWNTLNLDCSTVLTKLYDCFPKSKHCEISMCYDVNETGEFTYLLGRGIDQPDDLKNIQPDMTRVDIAGGLYAIFSTPPVAESYIQTVQDTWNEIFLNWLPQSEFEFDETRHDFEYHDHRDHGWYFGGKLQIDICIPIRQRPEEKRKSQLRAGR